MNTEAKNKKVLTEADSLADLHGLPRPSDSQQSATEIQNADLIAEAAEIIDILTSKFVENSPIRLDAEARAKSVVAKLYDQCGDSEQARTNRELNDLLEENYRLKSAMQRTINENLHLADGDVCTLIHLKRALAT